MFIGRRKCLKFKAFGHARIVSSGRTRRLRLPHAGRQAHTRPVQRRLLALHSHRPDTCRPGLASRTQEVLRSPAGLRTQRPQIQVGRLAVRTLHEGRGRYGRQQVAQVNGHLRAEELQTHRRRSLRAGHLRTRRHELGLHPARQSSPEPRHVVASCTPTAYVRQGLPGSRTGQSHGQWHLQRRADERSAGKDRPVEGSPAVARIAQGCTALKEGRCAEALCSHCQDA